jgi:hypothetical protein
MSSELHLGLCYCLPGGLAHSIHFSLILESSFYIVTKICAVERQNTCSGFSIYNPLGLGIYIIHVSSKTHGNIRLSPLDLTLQFLANYLVLSPGQVECFFLFMGPIN